MRFTKRLASLLLVAVMALALTIPALAAEHTYEIYQIFTGDVSGKTLSNVKWGENGTGTKGKLVEDDVLKALADVANGSDAEKLAVITKYVNLDSDAITPVTEDVKNANTEITVKNVPSGYYLIKDKKGSQDSEGGFYTLYVVKVTDGTLTFKPKGDVPTVDKEILEKGKNDTTTEVKHNSASIGDTVNYQITGTLPSNIDAYQTYYYQFTDTLSKGLTYADGSLNVAINGVTVSADKYELNVSTYDKDKGTTITITINDLKSIKDVTINDKTKVVVTYSAKLNENAVIAGEGNPNDVKLTYSNDPNHSGAGENNPKGETPKDEVVTYTTELTITKHDGDGNILPGAAFTLSGKGVNIVLVTEEVFTQDDTGAYYKLNDGTYTKEKPTEATQDKYEDPTVKYAKSTVFTLKGAGQTETKVVGTVDSETGKLTFRGLGAGDYTLTESKTPAGYNTITPINFTITFNTDTKEFESTAPIQVESDNTLSTTIVNKAGVQLPETGGIGTTIFYTLGAVLVVGAGVLLVTKKRMDTEK